MDVWGVATQNHRGVVVNRGRSMRSGEWSHWCVFDAFKCDYIINFIQSPLYQREVEIFKNFDILG